MKSYFDTENELDANSLYYYAIYYLRNKEIAMDIFIHWRNTFDYFSQLKIFEKDNARYSDLMAEQKSDIEKFGASKLISGIDSKKGKYIFDSSKFRVYFSNSKNDNYNIEEADKSIFMDYYPNLFLTHLYIIERIKVFDFIKHQVDVNFNKDLAMFKQFYSNLEYHCIENEAEHLYNKNKEQVLRCIETLAINYQQNSLTVNNTNTVVESQSKENDTSEFPLEDLSITKKIILLDQLGIIQNIKEKNNFLSGSSIGKEVAKLLDEKADTCTKYVNAIMNKYKDKSNPYNNAANKEWLNNIKKYLP